MLLSTIIATTLMVTQAPPAAETPQEAIQRLADGNARSLAGGRAHKNQPDRSELALTQTPYAVVLGCSDSRVPPEIVFDEAAGQLFVVRVAGNVVDSPTLGSVEYGVEHLHAKVVLVLGHGSCGAVKASLAPLSEQAKLSSNIRFLLDRIVTGPSTDLKDAAIENVRAQLSLLASDPIIEEEIAKGQVALVGGFYDIATGKVEFLK